MVSPLRSELILVPRCTCRKPHLALCLAGHSVRQQEGMAAVTICSDFGAQKNKSDTVSTVSPSISHEVMGLDAMVLDRKSVV